MHVGVLRLTFHVPHARSLKEKRSVVRRIRDRLKARFAISIAEVACQDLLQKIVLGACVVSADAAVCDRLLAEVAHAAELAEDAQLLSRETELVAFGDELFGDGGAGDWRDDGDLSE